MQLTQESICKFKKIYQAQFGIHLTDEEAERKAKKFLRFFRLIVQGSDV